MSHGLYAYPRFQRAGLANLLFAWARSEIFSSRFNVPMLAPQWVKPRLGPMFRGEHDWRYYNGIFSAQSYVRGLRRVALLLRAMRIPEEQLPDPALLDRHDGPKIVEFYDMTGHYKPLIEHHAYLARRLREILQPRIRQQIEDPTVDWTIGVHVRRGDMRVMAVGEEPPAGGCATAALEWFIGCVRSIRQLAGGELPVRVFSDGRDEELAGLLALPNVKRGGDNPAIVDLFLLSRSPMLVTTSGSTFSGWASFLGRPLAFWYPRTMDAAIPATGRNLHTDFQGNVVSAEAREAIRNVMTG